MDAIYVFLIRNDVWIYILCTLGLLWYLAELLRAQSALRRAMFGLERETALRTRNTALFFIFIFGGTIGLVAYANEVVRPRLPESMLRPPTPTPGPGPAQTTAEATGATADATEPGTTPTSPVAPTVTLPGDEPVETAPAETPTPGPTPTPSATPRPVAGCSPSAFIREPASGKQVAGTIHIYGTADTPDFAYYELEISGPQTNGAWANLIGRRVTQRVEDGFLGGNVNLSQWEPGSYLLRLTVGNAQGQMTNQCVVDIVLGGG
ncbi:MAG: hypothetical protein R3248_01250 [Candidatus Promineifilaceae bacterium]|nr:hypothetical protein [Candidatus Promineifilaceae bacterium]